MHQWMVCWSVFLDSKWILFRKLSSKHLLAAEQLFYRRQVRIPFVLSKLRQFFLQLSNVVVVVMITCSSQKNRLSLSAWSLPFLANRSTESQAKFIMFGIIARRTSSIQARLWPQARLFSTPVPSSEAPKPDANSHSIRTGTHKVDNLERKMLVWTGKYKTAEEIPAYIKWVVLGIVVLE